MSVFKLCPEDWGRQVLAILGQLSAAEVARMKPQHGGLTASSLRAVTDQMLRVWTAPSR